MNNCFILQIIVKSDRHNFDHKYKLQEVINLAEALHLNVVDNSSVFIEDINPATLVNSGVLNELNNKITELKNIDALIVNYTLSAIQQRNLENYLKVKVLDRNALIINIFSLRAQSKEGKLQSELASLYYQKSRIVKAWSHLERQRGGASAVGGPGETQKELDKRMVNDKIYRLKKKLLKVKLNRSIQSHTRKKSNLKTVALVGYTNSGKSTLFNSLTNSSAFARNLLFATLDTTSRALILPHKQKIILSDTVGFISDLPHQLIEAFHSTLEGVLEADLILHVIDSNQTHYQEQILAVKTVLSEIGIDQDSYKEKVIEVYNKMDLLNKKEREDMNYQIHNNHNAKSSVLVSAIANLNIESLKSSIFEVLNQDMHKVTLNISYTNSDLLVYLYNTTIVLNKVDFDIYTEITLLCYEKEYRYLENNYPSFFIKSNSI